MKFHLHGVLQDNWSRESLSSSPMCTMFDCCARHRSECVAAASITIGIGRVKSGCTHASRRRSGASSQWHYCEYSQGSLFSSHYLSFFRTVLAVQQRMASLVLPSQQRRPEHNAVVSFTSSSLARPLPFLFSPHAILQTASKCCTGYNIFNLQSRETTSNQSRCANEKEKKGKSTHLSLSLCL